MNNGEIWTKIPSSLDVLMSSQVKQGDQPSHLLLIQAQNQDFPDGSVVKNPPSNAGDVGFIPGRGTKIPCTLGQLSLW